MSVLPKWKKSLSKKELDHLKEMNVTSFRIFKKVRADQLKLKAKSIELGIGSEPCWNCRKIASKVGID